MHDLYIAEICRPGAAVSHLHLIAHSEIQKKL